MTQAINTDFISSGAVGIFVDTERCTGCRSCEISCKMELELPAGPIRPMRVMELGPEKVGEKLHYDFIPMNCFHCGNAPCIEACPTGAMQKRDDGIVFVDKPACIGCKQCIKACPFGAPQYDPASGKIEKCDLCMHRIDVGLEPACVSKCLSKALQFAYGDYNLAVESDVRTKRAREIARSLINGSEFIEEYVAYDAPQPSSHEPIMGHPWKISREAIWPWQCRRKPSEVKDGSHNWIKAVKE